MKGGGVGSWEVSALHVYLVWFATCACFSFHFFFFFFWASMYFFWLFRLYDVFHEKLLCKDFFPTPITFRLVHPLGFVCLLWTIPESFLCRLESARWQRGLGALTPEYLLPGQWVLRIHFRYGTNSCSHHSKQQNIRWVTLHVRDRRSTVLLVTEIAPESLVLYGVNRSLSVPELPAV